MPLIRRGQHFSHRDTKEEPGLRNVSLLIAVVAVLLGVTTPAAAITWGQRDGTDHPHVVALLFLRSDGFYSCSGTLLTPYVVLTAGHCTELSGQVNLGTWVTNDPEITFETIGNYPSVLDYLDAEWIAGEAVPHPNYADFVGFPNTRDVGIILLSQGIDIDTYGQLPMLGQFDSLRNQRGRQDPFFTIVGYGIQRLVPVPFPQNDFTRYQGESRLINTENVYTSGYNFQFTANPGKGNGSGGTCYGDSGGPAFYQDSDVIAAVTSYGITTRCTGVSFSYRADIAETLDFVTPYLTWSPE
jgi:hypothetical protein